MSLLLLFGGGGAPSQSVAMDFVTNPQTVLSPTVSVGSVTEVLPLVTNVFTVFSPSATLSSSNFTETWTGTDNDPWPVQWTTVFSAAGAIADIQSNKGRMATGTTVFGKVGARNSAAFTPANYTLTVDVVIPVISEWYALVHVRGAGSIIDNYKLPSSYQIRFSTSAGNVIGTFYEVDASGVETFRTGVTVSGAPLAGNTMRIVVTVSGSTTLLVTAWNTLTAEPPPDNLSSFVTTNYTGQYFGLSVQGGNNTTSEDILWDNFSAVAGAQTAVLPLVTNTPTVFSPTVTRGSVTTVLPLITNAFTVFSPTVRDTQTTVLPLVTNATTVFSPTVSAAQFTQLPFINSIQTVFSPTISVGSVTVVLPLVTNALTVFSPGLSPLLPLVVNTQTVFSPTITLGSPTIRPTFITNTPTVFSPTISTTSLTIVMALVYASTTGVLLDSNGLPLLDSNGLPFYDGTYGVLAPTVSLGTPTIRPALVSNVPTVFSPSIRGTQTMVLPLVSNTPTVFSPGVVNGQLVTVPLLVNVPTVFTPTISPTLYPILPLVTNTFTVFSPTITTTRTIEMERVINNPVVFSPSIVSPNVTVVVEFILNNWTVFAPGVVYRLYTFIPPHDDGGPRKLSEDGRRRQGVSHIANELAGRYGAPRSFSVLKINGVYVTIQGPTMDQVNAATEYYAGGHIHEVTYTQAQALEAAGFDVEGI